jgi:2-methylisocitrate lyase-like PEP mutase family enzyme
VTTPARFRSLHVPGAPLVLPNAWDVTSARLVEAAGAAAVATTSAGVAWSFGVPDGGALDRDWAVDVVRRIVTAVDVPVTADIEDGYADDPDGVADTVEALVASGAVGANIEDAWHGGPLPLRPVDDQVSRIRAASIAAGDDLFVNVRIDSYLREVGDPASRLSETLTRAAAYVEAGADGIFVPGVVDPAVVEVLVQRIEAPMNVMVGPGAPSVRVLGDLGVARISLGGAIAMACYGLVSRAASEVLATGTYESLTGHAPVVDLNAVG